ncbi:DUF3363 domain-containing protein [Bradyrhizobium sp. SRL28]|uniref:DUF3363 domain-containing protein n=1 Tax=Bradyrhizobium sp. SRL28 TaxID=2836178 RepID=UPI0035B33A61
MERPRRRELDTGSRLAEEMGLASCPLMQVGRLRGIYRRRLSNRLGVLCHDGIILRFSSCPAPPLERELSNYVSGIAGPGSVDWSLGHKRGLSL